MEAVLYAGRIAVDRYHPPRHLANSRSVASKNRDLCSGTTSLWRRGRNDQTRIGTL